MSFAVVAINFEVIGLCTCQILKWNEGLGYVCTQQTENLSSSIKMVLMCIICYAHIVWIVIFAIWQIIFEMENITTFSTIRLSYLFAKSCMTKFVVFFKDLICLLSQSISICMKTLSTLHTYEYKILHRIMDYVSFTFTNWDTIFRYHSPRFTQFNIKRFS